MCFLVTYSCRARFRALGLAFAAWAMVLSAAGEVLELTNGDQYRGTVISMTATTVEFQSDVQGRIRLPRNKIAQITLNPVAAKVATSQPAALATNSAVSASGLVGSALTVKGTTSAATNGSPKVVVEQMRQQGVDPKLVSQVQAQIIGTSSPESSQKFNELLNGLMGGSLSTQDIRAQAQDSIKQIQAARQELGPDAGGMLDGYMAILQQFVAETAAEVTPPAPPAPVQTSPK
jgi:hypothetical protein